jgi:hypothetical protein
VPLAALATELNRAIELQETVERVIAGCAAPRPVDERWSADGAAVVAELLGIASRVGDIDMPEQDSELKEDACYLVLWHQAAVDRAMRLAYTADATEAAERERTALSGIGAPREQLRELCQQVRGRVRAVSVSTVPAVPAPAGPHPADAASTQNSLPSTSASTTQLTSP